jgi:hypothetical protein
MAFSTYGPAIHEMGLPTQAVQMDHRPEKLQKLEQAKHHKRLQPLASLRSLVTVK